MEYRDIISLNKSFQYSINLQYDIDNLDKVKGYIPTKQSIRILKEYLTSIMLDSTDKTTVLIGPYGKGKSHLALVLMALISSENKTIINDLVKKIRVIDEETADLIKALTKNKTRFLPLIINSNSQDLQQSFLMSLKQAIEKYGLEEIELNTYFTSVIDLINLWKKSYKDTLNILEKELSKFNITVDQFIKELESYSSSAYQIFVNIYPIISSGVEYNPMLNTDVVKIIEEFNYKICEQYGYKGIFMVFDEFSKFIEASTDRNNAKDMKVLQDIAELCNRTKENQIHLACITHKSINEYISKIPSNKIDMWRAIEGRFKEIYFTTSSKQNYELIGNTIISDKEKIKSIINKNNELLEVYERGFYMFKGLYNFESYKNNIAINAFPLNPITVFVLPSISEKVAQNERTLFTFLSKRGSNTLSDFLSKNEVGNLLEIDVLYNYFEELFKKEIFNEKIREIWMKCDAALKKSESLDEEKIIKGLAIIKIIDVEEVLSSTKVSLKSAFLNLDVDFTVDNLVTKGILIKRKSNNTLDFMPGIKIDINQKINDVINTRFRNINLAEELEKIETLGYITAKKYNDEYSMTRFFRHKFMTLDELLTYSDINELISQENSDGIILNVIEKNCENLQNFIGNISKYNYATNLILNVPKKPIGFENDVLELLSVRYLKEDEELLKENEILSEYLDILEEDLLDIIKNNIAKVFDIETGESDIYWQGDILNVNSIGDLNRKISKICENIYNCTPKINNEMINKRKISSIILKARNKIIDGILSGNLDFTGNGPEVTIARATLTNKGLFTDSEVDKDIDLVLQVLKKELIDSEGKKKSFKDIYEILEGASHGFGMRKGIIPIYLTVVLSGFKDEIILYTGERTLKEVPLNSNTINNINEHPNMYFIEIDKGTKEKDEYFLGLEKLFEASNIIKTNKYERVVYAMQDWIKSLDKFTRIHELKFNSNEKIDRDIVKLRKELLKYDINIRSFIFVDLPNICGTEDLYEALKRLNEIKYYLDNRCIKVKYELSNITKNKLTLDYNGSLSQSIKLWINSLQQYKKDYLYDVVTNKLIEYGKELSTNNEEIIIDQLSVILTGLTIGDWNDKTIKSYLETLDICLEKIKDLEEIKEEENSDVITLVSNANGKKHEKIFKKTDVSVLGNTLINQLEETIEEYGSSITDDEKRTILIGLLEKFI